MTDFNGFRGAAKRLEDIDLPRIGHMIGVGEDVIHAVLDVESAGRGFDAKGRPKMLFEPHIFWRELGAGAKRDAAAKAGLAYAKWKSGAYPSDSYPRLEKAMAIDETAALRSASFGLGQVMGFNHKAAGYATAQAFVLAMLDDEDKHLEAMIAFIKNNRLDDDLRRKDWAGFAKGYNGAGFAKHGYHTKLAKAYAHWQRFPDTPFAPGLIEEAWEVDDTPVYDADSASDVTAPEPQKPAVSATSKLPQSTAPTPAGQPDDPGLPKPYLHPDDPAAWPEDARPEVPKQTAKGWALFAVPAFLLIAFLIFHFFA